MQPSFRNRIIRGGSVIAKLLLVVPKKNDSLTELACFLKSETADIYIFPEGFLKSNELDTALEVIAAEKAFVITGCKEESQSGIREKALIIDSGRVVGEYTKCILTGSEKAKGKIPGSRIHCVDTRFGKIAVPICYEIHFPEVVRIMSLEAPVLVVNLIGTGMYHDLQYDQWTTIAKARAIENEVCTVGCSHYAGEIPIVFAFSNSGNIIFEAKGKYGSFAVGIDLFASNRRTINYCKDRVPELFNKLSEQ